MSSTAITESNTKTTVIVPYPEGAQVQAELEKWQKALELYAMENKFGPALTDASSRTEYDHMPANIATMAGQAWAAVSKSIKHSKSLKLEVEGAAKCLQPRSVACTWISSACTLGAPFRAGARSSRPQLPAERERAGVSE